MNFDRCTFWNSGNGEGDSYFEVVDCSLNPRSSVSRVVEVSDVDGPDSDANEGDHLGQLLSEFVKLLLEGGLDLLSLSHLSPSHSQQYVNRVMCRNLIVGARSLQSGV